MRRALTLAEEAMSDGEVPVGCVIVHGEEIVGEGRNRRERDRSAVAHAETEAIAAACRRLGGWRLFMCDLYVTLEPCPMCAGAVVNARIPNVYFGAKDPKAGACGSVFDLFSFPLNHRPASFGGLLSEECAGLLQTFFRSLRSSRQGTQISEDSTCPHCLGRGI